MLFVDGTFEINRYFILRHYSKSYSNTKQVAVLYFTHPVLPKRRSFENIKYASYPLALWEIQTAQEPVRTREVSLPYNNEL